MPHQKFRNEGEVCEFRRGINRSKKSIVMSAFFRPSFPIAAALASLVVASAANALPAAKPGANEQPSKVVKVNDRYDSRYHRRYYGDRNVVHAPFTRVESGRRTVVDAPFAHVHTDRYGRTHVRAPFVNYWD
jgi:hypothetical protein